MKIRFVSLFLSVLLTLCCFVTSASEIDQYIPLRIDPAIAQWCNEADVYTLLEGIHPLEASGLVDIDVFDIHSDLNDMDLKELEIISDRQIDSKAKGESYVLKSEKVWFEDEENQTGLCFRIPSNTKMTGPEENSRANSREFRLCFFRDNATQSENYLFYSLNWRIR
jgi:hypothetical protein